MYTLQHRSVVCAGSRSVALPRLRLSVSKSHGLPHATARTHVLVRAVEDDAGSAMAEFTAAFSQAATAIPESAPAASEASTAVSEVVTSIPESAPSFFESASTAVSEAAAAIPESAPSFFESASTAVSEAATAISESAPSAFESASTAVSEVAPAVTEAVTSAYKVSKPTLSYPSGSGMSVTPKAPPQEFKMPEFSAPKLPEFSTPEFSAPDFSGITSSFSGFTSSITDSVSGLTSSLSSSVDSVTGTASGAVGSVSDSFSTGLGAVSESSNAAIQGAQAAVSSTIDAVTSSVGSAASQVVGSLPPEVQSAVGEVVSHGSEIALVSVFAGFPIASAAYNAKYGGYAGELTPAQVKSQLDGQRILLIDIREEEVREKEGLLDLRLTARTQAVALPVSLAAGLLPPKIQSLSSSKDQLLYGTHSALVTGLNKAPLSKLVIMDSKDSSEIARKVARSLQTEASVSQAFVMQGGFQQWVSDGLPALSNGSVEYDANLVKALGDEFEVLTKSAGSTLGEFTSTVTDPTKSAPVLAGGVVAVVAVANYHLTLELIGIGGLAWSIYSGDVSRLVEKAQAALEANQQKAAAAEAKKQQAEAAAAQKAREAAQKQGALQAEIKATADAAAKKSSELAAASAAAIAPPAAAPPTPTAVMGGSNGVVPLPPPSSSPVEKTPAPARPAPPVAEVKAKAPAPPAPPAPKAEVKAPAPPAPSAPKAEAKKEEPPAPPAPKAEVKEAKAPPAPAATKRTK